MRTCLQVDIIFKKAAIEEERRFAGKKGEIDSLILQHIEAENWHIAIKFLFVEDEEAALMALCQIVDHLLTSEGHINIKLPLDEATVKRLVALMGWSSSISDLCYVTWYLSFAARDHSQHQHVWNEDALMAKVLSNLRLPDANLQTACVDLLKNLAETRVDQCVVCEHVCMVMFGVCMNIYFCMYPCFLVISCIYVCIYVYSMLHYSGFYQFSITSPVICIASLATCIT
jgi:hypothetical protein